MNVKLYKLVNFTYTNANKFNMNNNGYKHK